MKSLDNTFLQYACDQIGETDKGLSGKKIVELSRQYAIEYNRQIPHSTYPFPKETVPNKRTVLLENIRAFDAAEQFKIIKDICELTDFSKNPESTRVLELLYQRFGEYADKSAIPHIDLPKVEDDTLQLLIEDMERNIRDDTPELVLDRLHTFSAKFIREICQNNGIDVKDDKGKYYPLHSLIGMLSKQYDANQLFQSTFIITTLKSSISVFENYNTIRNTHSFAHDNEVLNKIEAEYVVKTISNLLCFIDKIEKYRNKETKKENSNEYELLFNDLNDVVPF